MHPFLHRIEKYCLSNSLWIHLVLLLFFSYLLLITMMVESYANFLLVFGRLILLFAPPLLYAAFRENIRRGWPVLVRRVVWGVSFVAYPIFVLWQRSVLAPLLLQDHQLRPETFLHADFSWSYFLAIAVGILVTETAVLLSGDLLEKLRHQSFIRTWSVEKLVFGVVLAVAVLAGLLATVDIVERRDLGNLTDWPYLIWKFLSFSVQFAVIGSIYYAYYYVNKHWLIPSILRLKGAVFYLFALAGVILIFYPLFVAIIAWLPAVRELEIGAFFPYKSIFAEDKGTVPFVVMLLSVPVIVSSQWFRQHDRIDELEKEKLETELTLLKQQINPHFFFNTLNNLYALSIDHDRRTPEVVLQLSELMRYVIYKGREDWVSLKEEIQYIEDYIRLQQIRLHKQLDFEFIKEIEDNREKVPPLLFITFVENAFKHGIEPATSDCLLKMHLRTTGRSIQFRCVNSVHAETRTERGIGLSNLRRRLDLRFPGKYQLEVQKADGLFEATLKIESA